MFYPAVLVKHLYRKIHSLRGNRVSQLNKTSQDDAESIKHTPLRRIQCSQEWTFGGASLFENHPSGFLLVFIHNRKKILLSFCANGKEEPRQKSGPTTQRSSRRQQRERQRMERQVEKTLKNNQKEKEE